MLNTRTISLTTPKMTSISVQIDTSKILGAGTFATVYVGFSPSTNEFLAVKAIRPYTSKLNNQKETFTKEIEIMAHLTNNNAKNVVRIHGSRYSTNNSEPYFIAMDLGTNDSLASWLEGNKNKTLLPQQKIKIIIHVATGLMYIHELGVLHRDIKPDNVVLNNDMEAKICDFGLSKRINKDNLYDCGGTDLFMAPEIILAAHRNLKHCYDQKADIYSFSLLCWCVITNNLLPYADIEKSGDVDILIQRVVFENFREPIPFEPLCPKNVSDFIHLGWDPNPDNRPTDSQTLQMLSITTSQNIESFAVKTLNILKMYQKNKKASIFGPDLHNKDVTLLQKAIKKKETDNLIQTYEKIIKQKQNAGLYGEHNSFFIAEAQNFVDSAKIMHQINQTIFHQDVINHATIALDNELQYLKNNNTIHENFETKIKNIHDLIQSAATHVKPFTAISELAIKKINLIQKMFLFHEERDTFKILNDKVLKNINQLNDHEIIRYFVIVQNDQDENTTLFFRQQIAVFTEQANLILALNEEIKKIHALYDRAIAIIETINKKKEKMIMPSNEYSSNPPFLMFAHQQLNNDNPVSGNSMQCEINSFKCGSATT